MADKNALTRRLDIVVSEGDYQRLQTLFAASTSHSFSAYCRDVILARPVIFRYYNVAADEFLVIALDMKRELEDAIRLLRSSLTDHTLDIGDSLIQLVAKIDELKLIMHLIYQQWSST
jgi:hypothetical protein